MNGFVRPRFAPTYVGYVFSARDIFLPLLRSGGGEGRGEGESLFQSCKSLLSPALLHGMEEREKGHAQQLLPRRLPPSSPGRESAQNSVIRATVGSSLAPCCSTVELRFS